MKTLKAYPLLQDVTGCTIVHVFTLSTDNRRYTEFYNCGNPVAANRLIKLLMDKALAEK